MALEMAALLVCLKGGSKDVAYIVTLQYFEWTKPLWLVGLS